MMSADNQLDRRIDLQELKVQQQATEHVYGQIEKPNEAMRGMMRYSEEYVRNSLMKQSKHTVNTLANVLSSETNNEKEKSANNDPQSQTHQGQIQDPLATPVESLNSPVGPIAYASKYKHNAASTNIQSSNSMLKTTQQQITNTSQMMKRMVGKADSLTTYGLSANMPVAPIVH